MVPKQGTAIGAAIKLASKSFTPGEGKSKAIIIITDGENHEDDPLTEAEEAAKAGIVIHAIGTVSYTHLSPPIKTKASIKSSFKRFKASSSPSGLLKRSLRAVRSIVPPL